MINDRPLIEYHCECGRPLRRSLPNAELLCNACNRWSVFREGQLVESKILPKNKPLKEAIS